MSRMDGKKTHTQTHIIGRSPGSSEVPRNPLTRWDVSSIPANGIFIIVFGALVGVLYLSLYMLVDRKEFFQLLSFYT